MKTQELSIADYKVLSTEFDGDKAMSICLSGSYDIKLKKTYGVTRFNLTEWSEFLIKVFESEQPFGEAKEILLDFGNIETLEFIQEVEMVHNKLFLRGFSKESGRCVTSKT